MLRILLLTLTLTAPGLIAETPDPIVDIPQQPLAKGINLCVLQGESVVNLLPAAPANNITIRVTDNDGHPIKNAVAIFQMPETGPTSTFEEDVFVKVKLTDTDGQTSVTVHPNSLPGHFEPKISVNAFGQTNTMILHQENRAPTQNLGTSTRALRASRHKGFFHSKAFWIAVTGGAVAAIFLVRGHHSSSSNNGGITVTPGTGSVGN